MAPRERTGTSWFVLILVIVCALGVAAAASAISGAASAPPPTLGAGNSITLPAALIDYSLVIAFGALIGFLLYRRLTSDVVPVPTRFVAIILLIILLASLFVVLSHFFTAGSGFGGGTGPSVNNTGPIPTPDNNSTVLHGPSGQVFLGLSVPPWFFFLAVIGIAVAVALAATPQGRTLLFGWRGKDPRRARPKEIEDARRALSGAAGEIELGRDPREVIVALYGQLLRRIGPSVGDVDPITAEEIRVQHLERLGIRPEAAEALTRLFEEARYSSHPMGTADATRAVEVLRAAEADLERSRPES
jgi:Domain of unknown function (DUF4129)